MSELRFGSAGVPHSSTGTDVASGIRQVAALGLRAMELEFVHGVRIGDPAAEKVRQVAASLDVALTCHGPYYINLNSEEEDKRRASIGRILDTARAARKVGACSITFHAAFYMKADPADVHRVVRESLLTIVSTLRAEGNQVSVRPELTGKPSQYGDLEELLELSADIPGVLPCIDFSHLHARTGRENSLREFKATLERYAAVLGKESLQDLHLHVSGIEFGAKGEKRHLDLQDSDLKYKELLRALKEVDAGGVLICESPNLEEDAQLLQRCYKRLKRSEAPQSDR